MNFLSSLSRKLGFTGGDEYDRDEEIDEEELDEEEEEEDEEEYEESGSRFSFRLPFGGRRNQQVDSQEEEDEEVEEEEPVHHRREQQTYRSTRRGNVIHDARMDARAQETQYEHSARIVNVRQIEECREIIRYLLQGESVMLNLENIDPKDCGRVVDLLSGAAFALQGRMIKVAHLSYLLAPSTVHVIEEDIYAASRARYNR